MSKSPSATFLADRRRTAGRRPWSWQGALGLGLCFGVGYATTLRLLDLPAGSGWKGNQLFGVQSFPGTELDTLRRQFSDRGQQIRGDLDVLELERQQKRQAAESIKRQAELDAREINERQLQQKQDERLRLEAVQQEDKDPIPPLPPEPVQDLPPLDAPEPLADPSPEPSNSSPTPP